MYVYAHCRFLRARKFDVPKAKEMLLNAEAWRKEFGVDEIVKCVSCSFPPLFVALCSDSGSIAVLINPGPSISKRKRR